MTARRNNIDLMNEAELAVLDAVIAIGKMPADPLLTQAQVFCMKAKELVSDYVDREVKK